MWPHLPVFWLQDICCKWLGYDSVTISLGSYVQIASFVHRALLHREDLSIVAGYHSAESLFKDNNPKCDP